MVRELQTNGYHDRQTAVFLDGSPDFIKLAEAYGIPAMRVYDDDTMERASKCLPSIRAFALWKSLWIRICQHYKLDILTICSVYSI